MPCPGKMSAEVAPQMRTDAYTKCRGAGLIAANHKPVCIWTAERAQTCSLHVTQENHGCSRITSKR
ncbi:hypothetical protein M2244_004014 [Rhodoferax antarcticus]|nr:hypothetical protein [Rhodoferax antarcticus]